MQIGDELAGRVDENPSPQADDPAPGIKAHHGQHRGDNSFSIRADVPGSGRVARPRSGPATGAA